MFTSIIIPSLIAIMSRIVMSNGMNNSGGADTLILYEDYPTAIVNVEHYSDMERIYSIVVHELLHGFQHLQGEKRFPNELLGMNYPLLKENIELRNRERQYLYHAVMATTKEEQYRSLTQFIAARESRRTVMGQYLDYELSIETVEGPAFYVESQAYRHKSHKAYADSLTTYRSSLLNNSESSRMLRKSCYSSGLFLCSLLDELAPAWKETFFASDNLLYDMLKELVEWQPYRIHDLEISDETISIIESITKEKEEIFLQFEQTKGYHVYIKGDMVSKGFDPMNVIVKDNKRLHKRFISVAINDKVFQISQPVMVDSGDTFSAIKQLHLVLDEKSIIRDGVIFMEGVGEVKGNLVEKDHMYYIVLE
ncbi:hypothetical protein [Ornithinibacillus sp. FSL M8-0202]|uniref:hypothetical protein n=1 Tax=Ornithinibacillus sp. FSL M8-0202 TaxID=2921616 RepID=UPI0030D4E4C6